MRYTWHDEVDNRVSLGRVEFGSLETWNWFETWFTSDGICGSETWTHVDPKHEIKTWTVWKPTWNMNSTWDRLKT
jgi:hypothetical protein